MEINTAKLKLFGVESIISGIIFPMAIIILYFAYFCLTGQTDCVTIPEFNEGVISYITGFTTTGMFLAAVAWKEKEEKKYALIGYFGSMAFLVWVWANSSEHPLFTFFLVIAIILSTKVMAHVFIQLKQIDREWKEESKRRKKRREKAQLKKQQSLKQALSDD